MRLPLGATVLADVAADLVVLAAVTVFFHQPGEDAPRGVPLLARGRIIFLENLLNDRDKRPELGIAHRLAPRVRPRRRFDQRLLHRIAAVPQLPGNLPDT